MYKKPHFLLAQRSLHIFRRFDLALALVLCLMAAGTAQSELLSGQNYRIQHRNDRFSISATNANLKRVLSTVAETAHITVSMAESLDRKVTLEQHDLSLKVLLERLLRGLNHVIIYRGESRKGASVATVLVLSKTPPRPPMTAAQERLNRRIASYQRQIESLEQRLLTLDETGRQAKRSKRRIEMLRRSLERLQRQQN